MILYQAVFQTLLLYGSEIWVMMGAMLKVLKVFNHWVDIKLCERQLDMLGMVGGNGHQ